MGPLTCQGTQFIRLTTGVRACVRFNRAKVKLGVLAALDVQHGDVCGGRGAAAWLGGWLLAGWLLAGWLRCIVHRWVALVCWWLVAGWLLARQPASDSQLASETAAVAGLIAHGAAIARSPPEMSVPLLIHVSLLLNLGCISALPVWQDLPKRDLPNAETESVEALMLTPLLRQGQLQRAREAAAVVGPDGQSLGESGFLTTDEKSGKHMFYWYFPAQSGAIDAPLVVWLQGGPGGSSLFGLFSEMGPYSLSPTLQLLPRNSSWNDQYDMIFIDNPVGAGFSYTDNPATGFCKDTKQCVAENLHSLLGQFYMLHEEMQARQLFIAGESYGGHYVPGIGAYIVRQNEALRSTNARSVGADPWADIIIPLAGVAVGDGWISPAKQIAAYPDMMFGQGLLSVSQRDTIRAYCDSAIAKIAAGDMIGAFDVWDKMLNGDIWPYANLFHNYTGSNDYDNLMNTNAPKSFSYYTAYVNQPAVRKMLHVGNHKFPFDPHSCEMNLLGDFMVSFEAEVEILLEHVPVLLYSGQLDIIIGAATTENFLSDLQWSGSTAFAKAQRSVWRLSPSDPEVAGFVRAGGNLTYAVIRGAGHIAPYDQPARSLDMITRFIEGQQFPNYPNPVSNEK